MGRPVTRLVVGGKLKCSSCGQEKPVTEFNKNNQRSSGAQHRCKACHSTHNKAKWDDPAYRHRTWARFIYRRFGLTEERYNSLLARQGQVCAICQQPEKVRGKYNREVRLAVDHCHSTGAVRGLLCLACNFSIGAMGENPKRLIAAASYLESYGQ